MRKLPDSEGEFDLLILSIYSNLKGALFLFVPQHRSDYYESDALLTEAAKKAFPHAAAEIRTAGNCFAAGLITACVFHCMRALEQG